MDNTLSAFAGELKARNRFIKASFGGFAGSGKSRTATEFVIGCYKKMKLTKPVLIIDNEKGSRFLQPLFAQAGVPVILKETSSLADIIQAMKFLNEGAVDFLFIDSLTKVYYQFCEDYKAANRRSFMTLQDWGKIIPDWQQKFANPFVETCGNIVFTGRGGNTYDMETNDETGKKEFVKSGVKMKVAGETPFEPDLNMWMELDQKMGKDGLVQEVWREALILKDRSATIDGKTFKNPTFKDFEPVLDFLLAVPTGNVSGVSDATNMAATDTYDERKAERVKCIEEIEGCITSIAPGQSANEKRFKVDVLEAVFGTRSWEAVKALYWDKLSAGTNLRKEFTTETGAMILKATATGGSIDFSERIEYLKSKVK